MVRYRYMKFEKFPSEEKQQETVVESPSPEVGEVARRLTEVAHGEVNPEHVGIIGQNMSAEVARALAAAEENPGKGVGYAVELAGQLQEHITLTNEYFPDDAERNEKVKEDV